jgi:hypothetical protein
MDEQTHVYTYETMAEELNVGWRDVREAVDGSRFANRTTSMTAADVEIARNKLGTPPEAEAVDEDAMALPAAEVEPEEEARVDETDAEDGGDGERIEDPDVAHVVAMAEEGEEPTEPMSATEVPPPIGEGMEG